MSPGLRVPPITGDGIQSDGAAKSSSKQVTVEVPKGYNDDGQDEEGSSEPSGATALGRTTRKNWTLEVNTPVYFERKMTASRKMRHDSFIAW